MNNSRKDKVRKRLKSRSDRLRLSVFISNRHVYAQIIDDTRGVTLAAAKDTDVERSAKSLEVASAIGRLLAQRAIEKNIKQVMFDRGGKKYHGRVRSLAEAARAGGLDF